MTTRPPLPPVDDDPSSRGLTTRYDDREDTRMTATLNDRDRTRLEEAYDGTRPLGAGERHRWERTASWYGEGDRALIGAALRPQARPLPPSVAAALAERYPTTR